MTSVIIEYLAKKFNDQVDFKLSSNTTNLAYYTDRKVKISSFSIYGVFSAFPLVRRLIAWIKIRMIFRRKVDILVFGGGSIVQTVGNSRVKGEIIRVTRKNNKNVACVAIGVSIGPFRNEASKRAAFRFLNSLDKISVRDKRSFEYIEHNRIMVSTAMHSDLALSLPILRPADKRVGAPPHEAFVVRIAVCLRSGRSQEFYESIQKMIDHIASGSESLVLEFFELSGNKRESDGDEACAFLSWVEEGGYQKYPVILVDYNDDPLFYYTRLKHCDAVICVRLHAAVFAFGAGVPFAVCSYHEKCRDFAQLIGLPNSLILNEQAGNEEIERCAAELLSENNSFLDNRNVLMKDALRHFDFLHDI